jgi:hypothetical protein
MSDCFHKLCDLEASADEAPGLAADVLAWLVADDIISAELTDCVLGGLGHRPGGRAGETLENPADADGIWTELQTNGLQIELGRQVFYGGQSGVSDATCPRCGTVEPFADFGTALSDWCATGIADHACRACSGRSLINDWKLEPQWGVGHLQLTLWNWPPLSRQFRHDVSVRMNHHRLLYLYDKL